MVSFIQPKVERVEELFSEIDILSTSVVHQSVQHIDFSLKIQKPTA